MAEQAKVDSITAGIEPKVAQSVQPAATPRLDPREAAEVSEGALFPESSELNALMDVIKELEQKESAETLQLAQVQPLEPIVDANGNELNLEELEATAAGGGAGGGGDGSTFVRLLRIVEGVDPLAYNYEFEPNDVPDFILGGADIVPLNLVEEPPVDPEDPVFPTVSVDLEVDPGAELLEGSYTDADSIVVTITGSDGSSRSEERRVGERV